MPTPTSTRTVTLRLSQDLYEKTSKLALGKHKSLNALLQESVLRLQEEEERNALSADFDLLAAHPEECDMEYAIYAQAEVMLNLPIENGPFLQV